MQEVIWQKVGDFKVSNISLGKGQSCEVFYAINQLTMQKVAAKRISIKQVTTKLQNQLKNEIKNLTKVSSPFIVKLYDYCRFQDPKQTYLYIFLEFCDDIDLKKYLDQAKKKGLPQAEIVLFLRHIVEGYKKLYQNNIMHRDIKPANVLLKQGIAKLSDFGFSRQVENPEVAKTYTLLGTPLYTAPQILQRMQFSSKCDVWSVGVMLYQMLYGKTPWTGTNLSDLLQNIKKKPLQFGDLNRRPQLKELLIRMLKVKEEDRISWQQIFDHPLFKEQLSVRQYSKEHITYNQYRKVYLEYLKNNIVIFFSIRNSITQVQFKDEELSKLQFQTKVKSYKQISNRLIYKRNLAFFYAYILFLYYNNTNLIPQSVNSGMQFQLSLAKKAFRDISSLGGQYITKKPKEYTQQQWKRYKQTSDYAEFKKMLDNDYALLLKLIQQISNEAMKKYKAGQITPQKAFALKNIDNPQVFLNIMENNQKILKENSIKVGVCGLISYYIDLVINPQLLDNEKFEFGSFYQLRQKQYGLNQ